MPSKKFTALFIEKVTFAGLVAERAKAGKPVKPDVGRLDVFDATLPGFGLRVSKTGHKSFILMTRLKTGTQICYTIGTTAKWDKVDAARTEARRVLQEVDKGVDPRAKPEPPPASLTVRELCAQFVKRQADEKKRRSWKGVEAQIAKHILPVWGERDVRSIARKDVAKLLDGIIAKGFTTTANRVLATVKTLFRWAVNERGEIERSPAEGLPMRFEEKAKTRHLTDAEIVRLWKAAETLTDPFHKAFVHFLILTGQRRSEVAGLPWAEIDLKGALWTLPAERAKNGKAHEVPLSPQAIAALPKDAIGAFVFPGRGHRDGKTVDVPIGSFSLIKGRIDAALAVDGGGPIAPWTFHDVRRTVATGLAKLRVGGVADLVLNHTRPGVTAEVYDQYGYRDEKRHALEVWGKHVAGLIDPDAAPNVVQLHAAG